MLLVLAYMVCIIVAKFQHFKLKLQKVQELIKFEKVRKLRCNENCYQKTTVNSSELSIIYISLSTLINKNIKLQKHVHKLQFQSIDVRVIYTIYLVL